MVHTKSSEGLPTGKLMKHLIAVFFLLFVASYARANAIDSLKTNEDVERFLTEKVDKTWAARSAFAISADNWREFGKGKFFCLDVDNNGQTDLIVNGQYLFVVTDSGNGHYSTHFIDEGFGTAQYTITEIIYKNRIPLLVVKRLYEKYREFTSAAQPSDKNEFVLRKNNIQVATPYFTEVPFGDSVKWKTYGPEYDTLIFKFGDFVEYNEKPEIIDVENIYIETSSCFGDCPVFNMRIGRDRKAKYNALSYNSKNGVYLSTITTEAYNRLIQTINYIKLRTLKDNYGVGATDYPTIKLEIIYNNGQIKMVDDYGGIGTFGLRNLYNQFFQLRTTQEWK